MQYILDDNHQPVPCPDTIGWAMWMERSRERYVARTRMGKVLVSTVFLGLDHGYRGGPPVLFETMVFGGKLDDRMARYCTYDEARAGHRRMVYQIDQVTRRAALSRTSRNAREGRYLARLGKAHA